MKWRKKTLPETVVYTSDNGSYEIHYCNTKTLKMNDAFEVDLEDAESSEGWHYEYSLFRITRDGVGKAIGDFDTLEEAKDAAEEDLASFLQWTHDGHKWIAEDYSIVEFKTVNVLYCKDVIISSLRRDVDYKILFDRAEKHRKMVRETLVAMKKRGPRK